MLKFFRTIRKSLLMENKTGKYFKYAIGEIILVMIGILLALQVNAWNQTRLDRIEEKNILANIHNEFVENKVLIEDMMRIETGASIANMALMNLMGSSKEELNNHNLDSLFYESLPAAQFTSSQQSISNIVQNGKLNIIKDKSAIKLIYQWESIVKAVVNRETLQDDWAQNYIMPFMAKYISFKQMDNQGDFAWTGKSKLKKDYYPLFQELEYENYMDNFLFLRKKSFERYEEAVILIDKIIEVTSPYKKQ